MTPRRKSFLDAVYQLIKPHILNYLEGKITHRSFDLIILIKTLENGFGV